MAANNLKSTSISDGNWTTLKWVRRREGEALYTIIRWQLNRKIKLMIKDWLHYTPVVCSWLVLLWCNDYEPPPTLSAAPGQLGGKEDSTHVCGGVFGELLKKLAFTAEYLSVYPWISVCVKLCEHFGTARQTLITEDTTQEKTNTWDQLLLYVHVLYIYRTYSRYGEEMQTITSLQSWPRKEL